MSKEGSKPHALLHYQIAKAVLEGVETAHEISLSLNDLQNEFEDLSLEQTDEKNKPFPNNIILKVKIETKWDTSLELEDPDLEVEHEDDEESGDSSSSEDKKSH